MPASKAIDGDTGERAKPDDALSHCFIVRLDDEQYAQVLRHQARLEVALGVEVSRACAMRDLIARTIPRHPKRRTSIRQTELFGVKLSRECESCNERSG
jgi:hypothetical protein